MNRRQVHTLEKRAEEIRRRLRHLRHQEKKLLKVSPSQTKSSEELVRAYNDATRTGRGVQAAEKDLRAAIEAQNRAFIRNNIQRHKEQLRSIEEQIVSVTVELVHGERHGPVTLPTTMTVGEVRHAIANQYERHPSRLHILLHGRLLRDETTLAEIATPGKPLRLVLIKK